MTTSTHKTLPKNTHTHTHTHKHTQTHDPRHPHATNTTLTPILQFKTPASTRPHTNFVQKLHGKGCNGTKTTPNTRQRDTGTNQPIPGLTWRAAAASRAVAAATDLRNRLRVAAESVEASVAPHGAVKTPHTHTLTHSAAQKARPRGIAASGRRIQLRRWIDEGNSSLMH